MSDDPAFPIAPRYSDHGVCMEPGSPGLSIRDWFAGLAMQGIIADGGGVIVEVAAEAYRMADAMLAERKREIPS